MKINILNGEYWLVEPNRVRLYRDALDLSELKEQFPDAEIVDYGRIYNLTCGSVLLKGIGRVQPCWRNPVRKHIDGGTTKVGAFTVNHRYYYYDIEIQEEGCLHIVTQDVYFHTKDRDLLVFCKDGILRATNAFVSGPCNQVGVSA